LVLNSLRRRKSPMIIQCPRCSHENNFNPKTENGKTVKGLMVSLVCDLCEVDMEIHLDILHNHTRLVYLSCQHDNGVGREI